MSTPTPVVDARTHAEVFEAMRRRLPGYVPGEWSPNAAAAGTALMQVFARYMELLAGGVNEVPERSRLAFLDMLGVGLLPAQAARVPLVFELMEDSPLDPTLPADSQVAAPAQRLPPSLLPPGEERREEPQPAVFSTAQTVTLTRARLSALYSLDPGGDLYADHLPGASEGFTLFDDMGLTEHALYLGHDRLFALAGNASVLLSFTMGARGRSAGARPLAVAWEYLSEDGWMPLSLENDDTEGLLRGGEVLLRKTCGPDAREETIHGRKSFWLRGRLTNPLPPVGADAAGSVPLVDDISARVGFTKTGLQPEGAMNDLLPLDTSNNFYPFGRQPARYSTFYLASREVFQRRGARINLTFDLSEAGAASADMVLGWEYHDGTDWRSLDAAFEFNNSLQNFTVEGQSKVSFLCPPDWRETSVGGVSSYWLRVRIVRGNYGEPVRWRVVNGAAVAQPSTLAPPVVSKLALAYTYQTDSAALDHCLAYNDFVFTDHSETCRWPRQTFEPFRPASDRQPAVHFGFDKPLPSGLVSLYLHVPPESGDAGAPADVPAFVWEYRTADGWNELGVLDETGGFQRSGMIQFIGQRDAAGVEGAGGTLQRIRARLKQGERARPTRVAGVWLNAVWGLQRTTVEGEVLGTSDGNPGQSYRFPRQPVLEGETVEVREWTGRGPDWETVVRDLPAADWREETSPLPDAARSVWVRWHARPHLYDSGPLDRHYTVERTTGLLRFGDGRRGRIPPAGGRIVASYTTGGGLSGNVLAGAVGELRTGIPYVVGVTNPVAAAGGAASERPEEVRERGAQSLRHRGRAVSAQDFEWLAREASPEVARARCLSGGREGEGRGGVSLLVIPHSAEPRPQATPELQRRVREHLAARAPATVARRIRISEARYVPVGVVAGIVPLRAGEAAQVEARVLARLNSFLHPLKGGAGGRGWGFGEALYLSQIASLIEKTPGVDYAPRIMLRVEGEVFGDVVPVAVDALVAAGDHEVKLTLGED
jgi:hypothetical protein